MLYKVNKNIVILGENKKKGDIISVEDADYMRLINLCLYNNWILLYDRTADDIIATQLVKNKRRKKTR